MRTATSRARALIALAIASFAGGLAIGEPLAEVGAVPLVACDDAVKIAKSRAGLEFQNASGAAAGARADTEMHLDQAELAAEAGNQAECWRQLRWSRIGSR